MEIGAPSGECVAILNFAGFRRFLPHQSDHSNARIGAAHRGAPRGEFVHKGLFVLWVSGGQIGSARNFELKGWHFGVNSAGQVEHGCA